jgi:hypothetical protein
VLAVLPQPDQLTDLLDRETQVARVSDEAQLVGLNFGVLAIPGTGPGRLREQPTCS